MAVSKALKDLGGNVISVSRNKTQNTITYDILNINGDDVIVNTTPVGMYPNVDASPLTKEMASRAYALVDIIFNPSVTKLMSYNKNSYNGLLMLIGQAAKAQDIWLSKHYDISYDYMLKYVEGVILGE